MLESLEESLGMLLFDFWKAWQRSKLQKFGGKEKANTLLPQYRIQSQAPDSSSGKRNAAALWAKDSSPPWHISNAQSANMSG